MTAEVDYLVRAGVLVTMDAGRRMIRDAALAVRGDRIVAVGKYEDLRAAHPARRVLGDGTALVMPGLIDAHNHPVHFLSKGLIDDMPMQQRWRERVWPYEAGLTEDETRIAATGTFLEMIRHGTTCFSDPGSFYPYAVAQAMEQTGMRGVLSRITWDVHDPTAPAGYNEDTETALRKAQDAVSDLNGSAGGRVRAGFSLVRGAHVTPELAKAVKALADEMGVGIHGHLSSTRAELEAALANWGMTPVARYLELGVLGPNVQLVHMGALEQGDVGILQSLDVTVCHCPSASMFGGFGCISHGCFPELVQAGVRVVLGTDASAVSRFLDMVRVMYLAACAHKDVKMDPTVIGAHKAMEMATVDAARGLLWQDEIGTLEAGKKADIVMVRTDDINWQPHALRNPVADLIYAGSGSCVDTVLIDGRVVLEGGRSTVMDEQAYSRQAAKAADGVFERMGFAVNPPWPMH